VAALDDFRLRAFPALACGRSAIGVGQGILLWLLYSAFQAHAWPAREPFIFAPLLLVALFIPIVALSGLGNLRHVAFASWLASSLLLVVVVGVHDAARNPTGGLGPTAGTAVFEPTSATIGALALALFIAHALVVAGDADRRPIAAYPTYFDVAWKHEVQLLLSMLFLGLFWGVLWLGAELFRLIGIDSLRDLITHSSFALPASALAFAYALHVTDIRVGLVRGMRNLLHVLLSWLLPLAAVLIIAFIASLPFTGLAPLWRTSHGSEIVLSAAAVLVVLINTAYRDGEEGERPILLRWAGSAAAFCLPVLVAISAYGLSLRVGQRGWDANRIVGAACLMVAGCYAAGYVWAAVATRPWLKRLEATNVSTSCAILALIVALTTPIADPARLAVRDQVARLESGRMNPDQFDFGYLRFHTARYGREALERLKAATGPNAEAIRKDAERALALSAPYAATPPTTAEIAAMAVFPPGKTLPQSFVREDWKAFAERYLLPTCLFNEAVKCEAFITDGGSEAVIVVAELTGNKRGVALKQDASGAWRLIGTLSSAMRCDSVREALRTGRYTWVPSPQMDLVAAGQRLTIISPPTFSAPNCQ
jgi:hypothetical protein